MTEDTRWAFKLNTDKLEELVKRAGLARTLPHCIMHVKRPRAK